MKKTLLDLVQDILSDMNSDQVNSISDTVEAEQVAQILKSTFEELSITRKWPVHYNLTQFTASGTTAKPTHLIIPENVIEIKTFWYDAILPSETQKRFKEVVYKEPEEFLKYIHQRNNNNSNVVVVKDYSNADLMILNDTAPTYWTTLDDEHIICDSYNSVVDSTLQSVKTKVYAWISPVWSMDDAYIPDIPAKAFPYYLAEAKSRCFVNIKQMPNAKVEQSAAKQRMWLAREKRQYKRPYEKVNYGRK